MPPRISLRKIACFVATADAGSVSAAARKLFVSQAALSETLIDLEDDLGTVLFVRHKARGVTLTSAGKRLLSEARNLIQHAEAFQALASERNGKLQGEVVIGCFPTLLPFLVPALLSGFRQRHPEVSIRLVEDTQPELEKAMLAGTIDVSILYDIDLVSVIDRRHLMNCMPYVLLPPGHRLADAKGPVDLVELIDEPYIQMDVLPGKDDYIFSRLGLMPRSVVQRTTNFELVRALVARGFGYSVLVQKPAIEVTYEGLKIVAKPIANPVLPLRVIIGWPAASRLNRRACAFVEFAASALDRTTVEAHGAEARAE